MSDPLGAWRGDRYEKIGKICLLRLQGKLTENEIARQVGFHSAEVMYEQLRRWDLPGWLVGGEPGGESAASRRARAGRGKVQELPPAEGAAPLFRQVLERLLADLDELPQRLEYLKDGRFVVERDLRGDFFVGEVTARLWRDDHTDEDWVRWCEEHGADPEGQFVDVPMTDHRAPRSASAVPPEPLATLIPVYILAGGDPGKLIDALQPARRGASQEQLAGIENRLKKEARRYATGVRGGDVKTGRKPGALEPEEHAVAIYVKERREQGATDEQILQELSRQPLLPLSAAVDEVRRLGNLELD